MEKKILTPTECAMLMPQWFNVVPKIIERLSKTCPRGSHFVQGQYNSVMDVPAIIIDPTGYILNGKHRAIQSFLKGFNLEACCVSGERDIIHHTPHKCYGETGIPGLIEALERKQVLESLCHDAGIYSIADLAKAYLQLDHKGRRK